MSLSSLLHSVFTIDVSDDGGSRQLCAACVCLQQKLLYCVLHILKRWESRKLTAIIYKKWIDQTEMDEELESSRTRRLIAY